MGNGTKISQTHIMRILHTTLRYPPASGGVEEYVHQIVERTRDVSQRRDVRVLTSKLRTHGPISELDPELLLDDPPYVQRLHYASTPLISYPRLQALQYYIGHHKPDIIHAYGFWYHPADGAARYARKHDIPFIFHPIYYENNIRKKMTWQLYKNTIGRVTFAAADVIAVISPFEQKLIEEAGFPVNRFELLPPGIDVSEFERPRQNPFLKQKITGPVLLTVSRIASGKGLNELISAFPDILRSHPNVKLAIIGEDFGAQAQLAELATRLGIRERVYFLGKLTREQLIAAYQHAAVFVHPSHYEAFGIVIAEAQAAGLPVVARRVAAVPYVAASPNRARMFTTQQELIQQVLSALTLEDTKREHQVFTAKQYIHNNFSWEKNLQKLYALYSEYGRK